MYCSIAIAMIPTAKAIKPMRIQSIDILWASFSDLLIIVLLFNKVSNNFQCFRLCLLQIVIYYHGIEFIGEPQFEFCFCDSAFNHFGGISTTALQAFTEFFYTGWLNENRQCAAAIIFLILHPPTTSTSKITFCPASNCFPLVLSRFRRNGFVYFFVFQKFIIGNALSEFLRR